MGAPAYLRSRKPNTEGVVGTGDLCVFAQDSS